MKLFLFLMITLFSNACMSNKVIAKYNIQNNVKKTDLETMLHIFYSDKQPILNSNKIDTSKFKIVHNIGKVPLSIKTSNLNIKSMNVMKIKWIIIKRILIAIW